MAPRRHSRGPAVAPGAARHKAQLQSKKPAYKVVLEEVTEKKKRLITLLSFNTKAPAGYTFIPAGEPQLTESCKKFAREESANVFIVSASKQKNVSSLSHEVHRVGYHFPSTVVEKACSALGVTLSSSGQILEKGQISLSLHESHKSHVTRFPRGPKTRRQNAATRDEPPRLEVSQAIIDSEASRAIRDLFPKIPDEDREQIVRHAFQKGHTRVGTADLPLTRRATLAVVAHIRHTYTDYDQLLRVGSWEQARNAVEHMTLDKLVEWRADKDDNTDTMSDILREVIVIDDDDDNDDEGGQNTDGVAVKSPLLRPQRDSSVEILSSQAEAETLQTQQISYRDLEEVDPEQIATLPDSRSYIHSQQTQQSRRRQQRSDAHRRQAWQDARSRYRAVPAAMANPINSQYHLGSRKTSALQVQLSPRSSVNQGPLPTQVVDLTKERSIQQAPVTPKVNGSILTDNTLSHDSNRENHVQTLHGRSSNMILLENRHQPVVGIRELSMYDQHSRDPQRSAQAPRPAEYIMRSVEGPFVDDTRQTPSKEHPRTLEAVDRHLEGSSRFFDSSVDKDYFPGKRRKIGDLEPLTPISDYAPGWERLGEPTVLLPLHQVRETYAGRLPSPEPRHVGHVVETAHDQWARPYELLDRHMKTQFPEVVPRLDCPYARGGFCGQEGKNGFSKEDHRREHIRQVHPRPKDRDTSRHGERTIRAMNSSAGNAGYLLPAQTAADPQPSRRPHLQVQLMPQDAAIQGRSPFSTVGPEHDQTLHASHSSRSLLAPVPIHQHLFSERDRHVYTIGDGQRRSERIVPLEVPSSPPQMTDHSAFVTAPEVRANYPGAEGQDKRYNQLQSADRLPERSVAITFSGSGNSSSRAVEASPTDIQQYPSARTYVHDPYHYHNSPSHMMAISGGRSVTQDMAYSRDHDATAQEAYAEVRSPYDTGRPIHGQYSLPTGAELYSDPPYLGATTPRCDMSRKDFIVID